MAMFDERNPKDVVDKIDAKLRNIPVTQFGHRNKFHGHRGEIINRLLHDVEGLEKLQDYAFRNNVRADIMRVIKQAGKVKRQWLRDSVYGERSARTAEEKNQWALERAVNFEVMKEVHGFGRF